MEFWVRSLASFNGLRIWHCHELWCRLEATAPISPLAWEPPYAAGVAPKRQKDQKKKKVDLKREQPLTAASELLTFELQAGSVCVAGVGE